METIYQKLYSELHKMKRTTALHKVALTSVLTVGFLLPVWRCACTSSPAILAQSHCQSTQTSRHDCEQDKRENPSSSCCCSKIAALDQKAYLALQSNASERSLPGLSQADRFDRPDQIVSNSLTKTTFSEYPRLYSCPIYLLNSSLLI